jgi:hypothetical protein
MIDDSPTPKNRRMVTPLLLFPLQAFNAPPVPPYQRHGKMNYYAIRVLRPKRLQTSLAAAYRGADCY